MEALRQSLTEFLMDKLPSDTPIGRVRWMVENAIKSLEGEYDGRIRPKSLPEVVEEFGYLIDTCEDGFWERLMYYFGIGATSPVEKAISERGIAVPMNSSVNPDTVHAVIAWMIENGFEVRHRDDKSEMRDGMIRALRWAFHPDNEAPREFLRPKK